MIVPRLQFHSDLHLEKRQSFPRLKAKCKNLALLGDIGCPFRPNYKNFIKYCSDKWERVFLISGNHEFYFTKNKFLTDLQISSVVKKTPNVHFLNDSSFKVGDTRILGSTLWSNRFAQNTLDSQINKIHLDSVKWLESSLKDSQEKTVVLTHYLPTFKLIDAKFSDFSAERYATDLEYLVNRPVILWLCGHSHIKKSIVVNGIQVAINAGLERDDVE